MKAYAIIASARSWNMSRGLQKLPDKTLRGIEEDEEIEGTRLHPFGTAFQGQHIDCQEQ
jgi:hypothetical protein